MDKRKKRYNPLNYRYLRFIEGLKAVYNKKKYIVLIGLYLSAIFTLSYVVGRLINNISIALLTDILQILRNAIFIVLSLSTTIFIVTKIGTPQDCHTINENMRKSGFVNGDGEPPLLIKKTKSLIDDTILYDFYLNNVAMDKFKNKQEDIEFVLGRDILPPPEQFNKNKYIRLVTTEAKQIPKSVAWRPEYIDKTEGEFNIVLGMSKRGLLKRNMGISPHWLLCSSTGGGKSVLLKHIINQAIIKGAIVTIVDFKGGIDYENEFHEKCKIIIEETRLIAELRELEAENQKRIQMFKASGVNDLDKYNKSAENPLPRIIMVIDEAAELLDKEGLTKSRKQLVEEITHYIKTLSRLSRASGIHLILSGQRLDATILSGQIRNNLTYKICGRADDNLKEVVFGLGSSPAKDVKIPHYEQGLFVDNEGTLFRGFMPLEKW